MATLAVAMLKVLIPTVFGQTCSRKREAWHPKSKSRQNTSWPIHPSLYPQLEVVARPVTSSPLDQALYLNQQEFFEIASGRFKLHPTVGERMRDYRVLHLTGKTFDSRCAV